MFSLIDHFPPLLGSGTGGVELSVLIQRPGISLVPLLSSQIGLINRPFLTVQSPLLV
jgi:hypothetical protein